MIRISYNNISFLCTKVYHCFNFISSTYIEFSKSFFSTERVSIVMSNRLEAFFTVKITKTFYSLTNLICILTLLTIFINKNKWLTTYLMQLEISVSKFIVTWIWFGLVCGLFWQCNNTFTAFFFWWFTLYLLGHVALETMTT